MMCICRHRWATLNFDSLIPFAFRLSIFHFRSILDMCVWEWVSVSISTMERILQWIHVHKFNDTHTRLFSMIFLHICSKWRVTLHIEMHGSQFECINFAQWAKRWMRYSNKEYEIDWAKRDDYRYRQRHRDTHTDTKWEKVRKTKTKN